MMVFRAAVDYARKEVSNDLKAFALPWISIQSLDERVAYTFDSTVRCGISKITMASICACHPPRPEGSFSRTTRSCRDRPADQIFFNQKFGE